MLGQTQRHCDVVAGKSSLYNVECIFISRVRIVLRDCDNEDSLNCVIYTELLFLQIEYVIYIIDNLEWITTTDIISIARVFDFYVYENIGRKRFHRESIVWFWEYISWNSFS